MPLYNYEDEELDVDEAPPRILSTKLTSFLLHLEKYKYFNIIVNNFFILNFQGKTY